MGPSRLPALLEAAAAANFSARSSLSCFSSVDPGGSFSDSSRSSLSIATCESHNDMRTTALSKPTKAVGAARTRGEECRVLPASAHLCDELLVAGLSGGYSLGIGCQHLVNSPLWGGCSHEDWQSLRGVELPAGIEDRKTDRSPPDRSWVMIRERWAASGLVRLQKRSRGSWTAGGRRCIR